MFALEDLDDTEHWERPESFNWKQESSDFADFVRDLESQLSAPVEVETGANIQDASFHSQVLLSGGVLRFSNFGRMIAFGPDSEIARNVLCAVEQLAKSHDYVLVSTSDLEKPYPTDRGVGLGIRTWWARFFDYL